VAEDLAQLRQQIDDLDDQVLTILAKRFEVVKRVAAYKKEHKLPVVQEDRMAGVVTRLATVHKSAEMTPEFISKLYRLIMNQAVTAENSWVDESN